MTPTDAEIIAEFERIETERDWWERQPIQVLRDAAKALGVPEDRVREVMVDHWTMGHSG